MPFNEEETKLFLITPKLQELQWIRPDRVNMEYYFTKGKIKITGDHVDKGKPKKADYLLKYNNIPMAVIEAKDESQTHTSGMQQAKEYAEVLDVKFAYSSNGHGIEEFDFFTNQQQTVDRFPSPEELWERLQNSHRVSADIQNLLSMPYYTTEAKTPRYYQEVAVRRSLELIAKGEKRLLLNLATGTGKTFISFQIAWKLKQVDKIKRILFLADRNVLCEQAYNTFEPFGNARDYINEGNVPTAREVYFSIYQAMYAEKDGKRLFQHYPKDFFDLIIIDECHRSGFGSWMDILNHFSSAIHLGMTATPKESENINTYKYFGKEENGFKALYEYSMSTGIEDGFLANFVLHRYKMNTDTSNIVIEEVIAEGAEVEVPAGAELRDEYSVKQFELDITLPDRTQKMCDELAKLMRHTGEMHKTIVFCVTIDHAREVAKAMQNHFSHLGFSDYAKPIVSEETNAVSLLRTFQDEQTERPVVATTVDLLSTGFDAPSVRNIVFLKYVNSPIMFKQILGRGCRISEDTGKYYFRIIDFTNASRLIDEWVTGPPTVTGDRTGNNMICGYVHDRETGNPIHAAKIILQLSPNQQKTTLANEDGYFVIHGLPESEIGLFASASKYRSKQRTVTTSIDCIEPLQIELVKQGVAPPPIKVTGLNVVFEEETFFEVEVTGQRLTLKEYIDYTKQKVSEKFSDSENLREKWADRDKRKQVVEELEKEGINTDILAQAMKQPAADELDLLSNIAFDKEIHTRKERADAVKNMEQKFINSFSSEQKQILSSLLMYYQLNGIRELDNPNVFNLFLPRGVQDAKDKFGSMPLLVNAITDLHKRIYTVNG